MPPFATGWTHRSSRDRGERVSEPRDPPPTPAAEEKPVTIEVRWGASLIVRGPARIVLADGTVVRDGTHASLCRCGYSRTMPFCDGTHTGVGFRGD